MLKNLDKDKMRGEKEFWRNRTSRTKLINKITMEEIEGAEKY